MDVETFLCQSRKKISFLKINLLNLGKNLVGPWGSTQLGERSPKPVSHLKSETRKVSHLTGPQNCPTCTCSTLPRASTRHSPVGDFRVAAVPESLSLLHSYLCMWPLRIELPPIPILAPLTKSAGFPGVQGTRERAARASTLQNAFFALLSC